MKRTVRLLQRFLKGLKKSVKKDLMKQAGIRQVRKRICMIRLVRPVYKNGRKIGQVAKSVSEVVEKRL